METVVALMAAATLWVAVARLVPRRDPAIAARMAALAPEAITPAGPRSKVDLRRFLAAAGRRVPGDRGTLDEAINRAGIEGLGPEVVLGARVVVAAAAFLAGMVTVPLASPVLAFAGWKLPLLLIGARERSRREEMGDELPEVIDLLAVCLSAGLNLTLAFKRVSQRAGGVLGGELKRVVARMELGVVRARALQELSERNDLEDLVALVSTLNNAERFGTPLASALEEFAGEIRRKRRVAAEERARRAPVKMLFPLVFLILPGFILLTLVPLLLGTFQSLGF